MHATVAGPLATANGPAGPGVRRGVGVTDEREPSRAIAVIEALVRSRMAIVAVEAAASVDPRGAPPVRAAIGVEAAVALHTYVRNGAAGAGRSCRAFAVGRAFVVDAARAARLPGRRRLLENAAASRPRKAISMGAALEHRARPEPRVRNHRLGRQGRRGTRVPLRAMFGRRSSPALRVPSCIDAVGCDTRRRARTRRESQQRPHARDRDRPHVARSARRAPQTCATHSRGKSRSACVTARHTRDTLIARCFTTLVRVPVTLDPERESLSGRWPAWAGEHGGSGQLSEADPLDRGAILS